MVLLEQCPLFEHWIVKVPVPETEKHEKVVALLKMEEPSTLLFAWTLKYVKHKKRKKTNNFILVGES